MNERNINALFLSFMAAIILTIFGGMIYGIITSPEHPKNSVEALVSYASFKFVEEKGHSFMILMNGQTPINFIHSPSCKCSNTNILIIDEECEDN